MDVTKEIINTPPYIFKDKLRVDLNTFCPNKKLQTQTTIPNTIENGPKETQEERKTKL